MPSPAWKAHPGMSYRQPNPEIEAKSRAERRAAIVLGIVFAVFMVVSIVGMIVFDIYGEKMAGTINAPTSQTGR